MRPTGAMGGFRSNRNHWCSDLVAHKHGKQIVDLLVLSIVSDLCELIIILLDLLQKVHRLELYVFS